MRVDIHTHAIPPRFLKRIRAGQEPGLAVHSEGDKEWIVQQGVRYPLTPAFWDVERKLEQMDLMGIDAAVVSMAPSMFLYDLDGATAEQACQRINDALADYVAQSGGRLYAVAAVPLQDPPRAAVELERAVSELGLRGAQIGPNVDGVPLHDERFEPFFAAAERLGVPVILHPYATIVRFKFPEYYMTNLVGYMVETCVAAATMILSGFLDRHPGLSPVLVHAGGYLPYQAGRLDHGFEVRAETRARISAPPSTYLRRFYYDTITHAEVPLRFLVDLVGADRILLGTDTPFDMADTHPVQHLAALKLDSEREEAIGSGNAQRAFHLDT